METIHRNERILQFIMKCGNLIAEKISKFLGAVFINTTTVNAASYSTVRTDHILDVTYTSTGAVEITIKSKDVSDGRKLVIKDSGGNASTNNITVITEGSETIDGDDSAIICGDNDSIELYCDGTNWKIY